ncbi:MAG: type IV secretory system conjugative DNA transfer family protein [Alphaproteobacteria bacterium]
MTKAVTEQPFSAPFLDQPPPDWIIYPSLFGLGVLFLVFLMPKRAKIGRARLATQKEIRDATRRAFKNINKGGVTLWVNSPKFCKRLKNGKLLIVPDKETIAFPNASQHIAAIGTTGAGKTESFLNRLAFSAVWQDMPIIAVDAKSDEENYEEGRICPTSEIAGFALSRGYEIFPVDPFGKDSCQINLVKLLRDPEDIATAKQVATAFTANCRDLGEKQDIWDRSAAQLIQAGLMIARSLPETDEVSFQDLAMLHKILARVNECPESIKNAKITQYQQAAFDQFLGVVKSPETAASVIFTAMKILSQFISKEITNVFCRGTNIPIVLKPKQMLIFRVHPEHKETVVPLTAAALQVVLDRNVFSGRGIGGLFLWDEAPQMRLPPAPRVMGVARSKKWVYALGLQGRSIMELEHGKDQTNAIFDNINTLWIGKLADDKDAERYSKRFGKEDIKSFSKGKGGTTTSVQQRDLVPIEEMVGQPPGAAIIVTPGVTGEVSDGKKKMKRTSIPYRLQIKLSRREKQLMKQAKKRWIAHRKVVSRKVKWNPLSNDDLLRRQNIALKILPKTESKGTTKSKPSIPAIPVDLWNSLEAIQQEIKN